MGNKEYPKNASWLRSWVQLPPGPFPSTRELRHYYWIHFRSLSDKNACSATEEMIGYYKSAVMEHIIQPIKDEVAELYLRYVPFIWNPRLLIARTIWLLRLYHQRDPLGTLRSEYISSPPPLSPPPLWVRMCLFNSALLPNIARQTLHR